MSFIASSSTRGFEPGWFLAEDEGCVRETRTVSASHAQAVTTASGQKIVPMGAVWPSNDGNAVGILYEDIDVTKGDAPGSVVVSGRVYEDRLPALAGAAKSALTNLTFITAAPTAQRPTEFVPFSTLSVASAAGSTSGKTKLTVSGRALRPGESYVYKTDASAAPEAKHGDDLTSGWTAWNGSADITATTSHKITVAVKAGDGKCVGSGSATVTSKA